MNRGFYCMTAAEQQAVLRHVMFMHLGLIEDASIAMSSSSFIADSFFLLNCITHVFWQAELLQQEIINRQRMSAAVQRLVEDLPNQAQAAEDRSFAAEYVKGYQLVRLPTHALLCSLGQRSDNLRHF